MVKKSNVLSVPTGREDLVHRKGSQWRGNVK